MILESLQSIKALLILDNNGDRVITKYYDDTFTSIKDKQDFEKNLFKKTDKTDYEIIAIQGLTVVYKSCVDLLFYVVGSMEENELILVNTLNTYFDSVSAILRKNVEKKALYEKMEHIILATDEIVEAGVIMEDDADSIVARVYPKLDKDIPLTEQTVAQVYQTAKEGFKWSLLR